MPIISIGEIKLQSNVREIQKRSYESFSMSILYNRAETTDQESTAS